VLEGRDLRRWRLELTPAQRRALLERIWSVAHGARYPYYFFRRNCATLMVELVDGVLPPAPDPGVTGWLAAPPASTLEPWQRRRGAGGGPLLAFVAQPILSFDHQARLTSRHRSSIEARLGGALGGGEAAALAAALREAHDPLPERRASAYERLGSLLGDPRAGSAADVHAWLHDAGAIESYLSTLANEQAEARDERVRRARVRAAAAELGAALAREADGLAAAGQAPGQRLAAALRDLEASDAATRVAGYRALGDLVPALPTPELAARARRLVLFVSESRYDVGRMKEVPGLRDALLFVDGDRPIDEQPYVGGFEDLVRPPVETRIAPPLLSLQRAKQALFAAREPGLEEAPPAAEAPAAVARAALERDYGASLSRSGIDQVAVLGGVAGASGAVPAAGVVLDGALYDERLGDHRRFGFPSDTALVVGRSAALLTPGGVAAYDARVFGYRSLRLPLPEAGGSSWPVGWETFADVRGNRARDLAAEVAVGWGLLTRLAERGDLRDHLLGSLSLAYQGYFPSAGAPVAATPQTLAAPVSLELRWGLGAEPRYRSWLGARAWGEAIVPFAGAPFALRKEVGAAVELHASLPGRFGSHDPALLVRGEVRRTDLTFTGAAAATLALAALGVELR